MELQLRTGGSLPVTPTITALPSELLRLIVSHLLPPKEKQFQLGSKKDLQNANLTHPCLRQWVSEFMFRDMALVIVATGMSSRLERLLLDPLGAKISKYIKRVQVKVPPAIRWELNSDVSDDLLKNTMVKLTFQHFKLSSLKDLTDEQWRFCTKYHSYMVEPFTVSARWLPLLEHAHNTCSDVFPMLPKLEHVECGICRPKSHPCPTTTNTFMTRWKDEVANIDLDYVEAYDTNLTWISGAILHSIPAKVKTLKLWAANLNDLTRFTTVNRLLSRTYRKHNLSKNPANHLLAVTNLTLCVGGQQGTHGTEDYDAYTGSTGMVKYWADVITGCPKLVNLRLVGERINGSQGVNGALSDLSDHGWLIWLFRRLSSTQIESVAFHQLEIEEDQINNLFALMPTSLKRLLLEHISLCSTRSRHGDDWVIWMESVLWLVEHLPSVRITLHNFRSMKDDNMGSRRTALAKLGVEYKDEAYISWRSGW